MINMAAVTQSQRKVSAEWPDKNYLTGEYYAATDPSNNPYYLNRVIYHKETEFDARLKQLHENVRFIIDCYQTIYTKLNSLEIQLNSIEEQNREILLLLGRGDEGAMCSLSDDFVEVSYDQMRKVILDYYSKHEVVYPSDIACEFNFDLEKVVQIINELIEEGRVVEAA